jgi:hypothetical protein
VLVALAAGGAWVVWFGRRPHPGTADLATMSWRTALGIGLCQTLALWPGTSRSMVTIGGGIALGLRAAPAAEFSFLLGLPTLGAACAHDVVTDLRQAAETGGLTMLQQLGIGPVVLGIAVATLSAALAVRWLVTMLNRNGLAPFGWYLLAVAASRRCHGRHHRVLATSATGRGRADYSHRFHAGNVGDVWKHCVLVAVLRRIAGAGRVAYLDTHAGEGRYALGPTGEWTEGIGRLSGAPAGGDDAVERDVALCRELGAGSERPVRYRIAPVAGVLGSDATLTSGKTRRHVRRARRALGDDRAATLISGDGLAALDEAVVAAGVAPTPSWCSSIRRTAEGRLAHGARRGGAGGGRG